MRTIRFAGLCVHVGLSLNGFARRRLGLSLCLAVSGGLVSCLSAEWRDRGFVGSVDEGESQNLVAAEWIEAGYSADVAAQWRDAGFSSAEAGPFVRSGFDPSEARAWCVQKMCQAEDAALWRKAGWDAPKKAALWGKARHEPSVSLSWDRAGFDPPEAERWMPTGVSPQQAREMVRYRVNPEHAERYVWLRRQKLSAGQVAPWVALFTGQDAYEWIRRQFTVDAAQTYLKGGIAPAAAEGWKNAGFSAPEAVLWNEQEFATAEARAWSRTGLSPLRSALWRYHGYTPGAAEGAKACGHPELAKEIQRKRFSSLLCQKFADRLSYLGDLPVIRLDDALADLRAWDRGCENHTEPPSDKRVVHPVIRAIREKRRFFYEAKLIDGSSYRYENRSYDIFFVEAEALHAGSFVHKGAFSIDSRISGYFRPVEEKEPENLETRLVLKECLL